MDRVRSAMIFCDTTFWTLLFNFLCFMSWKNWSQGCKVFVFNFVCSSGCHISVPVICQIFYWNNAILLRGGYFDSEICRISISVAMMKRTVHLFGTKIEIVRPYICNAYSSSFKTPLWRFTNITYNIFKPFHFLWTQKFRRILMHCLTELYLNYLQSSDKTQLIR